MDHATRELQQYAQHACHRARQIVAQASALCQTARELQEEARQLREQAARTQECSWAIRDRARQYQKRMQTRKPGPETVSSRAAPCRVPQASNPSGMSQLRLPELQEAARCSWAALASLALSHHSRSI